MANGEVSSCIMETVSDIYRAIDFSGLMFVTVIFVIAQVNGQYLKYVPLEINNALRCSVR